MTVVRPVFAVTVLLPLLCFCEVKRPREKVGAIGSIELMVAMAVAAIATFNLNLKRALAFSFCSHNSLLGLPFAKKNKGTNI